MFLSNVAPGGNLQKEIAEALAGCQLVIILATKTYGKSTNALFDTCSEMNFVIGQRKPYYLIRMLPFEETWAEPHVTMAFPAAIMFQVGAQRRSICARPGF